MTNQIKTKDGKYFGKVKRVVDPCYYYTHYVKEETERIIDEYDSFGNNITFAKDIRYNSKGKVIHKFVEDDESQWLETTSDYFYQYDKLIKEKHQRVGSWCDYGYEDEYSDYELTKYVYEGDLLIKLVSEDKSGQIRSIVKFIYNNKKQIIRVYTYHYTRGKFGLNFTSFPTCCYIQDHKYNKNDQLCMIKYYYADIKDNKVSKTTLTKQTSFYYDIKGRLKLKEVTEDAITYIYDNVKFDKHGNVTEYNVIKTYNDDCKIMRYRRIFEYYQ